MNIPTTAAQIRYENMQANIARERFMQHPEEEAEAIAGHYVRHALIAMQISQMIRMREELRNRIGQYERNDDLEKAINSLVREIKTHHLADFGIPLEWHPNAPKY